MTKMASGGPPNKVTTILIFGTWATGPPNRYIKASHPKESAHKYVYPSLPLLLNIVQSYIYHQKCKIVNCDVAPHNLRTKRIKNKVFRQINSLYITIGIVQPPISRIFPPSILILDHLTPLLHPNSSNSAPKTPNQNKTKNESMNPPHTDKTPIITTQHHLNPHLVSIDRPLHQCCGVFHQWPFFG